ncbi:hypothetical protein [Massilia sp. BSC265]|nr:hypothetical protein [Massilia sp. BSC265]
MTRRCTAFGHRLAAASIFLSLASRCASRRRPSAAGGAPEGQGQEQEQGG